MRWSRRPTVAPRCQHTCNAVLLRDGGVLAVEPFELRPHVSRPSSEEPASRIIGNDQNYISLGDI